MEAAEEARKPTAVDESKESEDNARDANIVADRAVSSTTVEGNRDLPRVTPSARVASPAAAIAMTAGSDLATLGAGVEGRSAGLPLKGRSAGLPGDAGPVVSQPLVRTGAEGRSAGLPTEGRSAGSFLTLALVERSFRQQLQTYGVRQRGQLDPMLPPVLLLNQFPRMVVSWRWTLAIARYRQRKTLKKCWRRWTLQSVRLPQRQPQEGKPWLSSSLRRKPAKLLKTGQAPPCSGKL